MVPPPLLHRTLFWLLALVAVLAALAWQVFKVPESGARAEQPRPARAMPFSDVNPYGGQFFLEREPDVWNQRKTVEMAAAAGIRWAKQHFQWYELEPRRGEFAWAKYDRIVNLFRAKDIQVIARLDYPPSWVEPAPWVPDAYRAATVNYPPADLDTFGTFVYETVKHFRGRVRFYQIWNEPNLISEWGFNPAHPVDPAGYVELLAVAYEAARKADPNAVILSAPLAFTTESVETAGNMSDLDFLEEMYRAGASKVFDVLASNAFGMGLPPGDDPDRTKLNFRRVELHRQIMEKQGDAETPIWFTEYGWNAAPASFEPEQLKWQRVSAEEQADWTVEGIRMAGQRWPWAGVFDIWYFRQWGGIPPTDATYYFAMLDVDFTPRRLYTAVADAAQALTIAAPGEWGERSAPVLVREREADCLAPDCVDWRWERADPEAGAADGNVLVAGRPGAALTFRFRGPEVAVRLARGPQAGAFTVKIDDRPVRGPGGGALFTLSAPEPGWVWQTLATGLGSGIHQLELTVGGSGGTVAIDGYRVGAWQPGTDARTRWIQGLGLVAAVLLALAALDVARIAQRLRSLA